MAETGDLTEGASRVKDGLHRVFIAGETGGVRLAGGATNAEMKVTGHSVAETALLGAAISVGLSQWDYVHERDNVRRQYELEIAAHSGKPPHQVNNKDLDALGKRNAVIADSLRRARVRRNIAFGAGIIAVAAAATLAAFAAPAIAGFMAWATGMSATTAATTAGAVDVAAATFGSAFSSSSSLAMGAAFLGKALAVGVASVATFMGVETAVTKAANPVFGMKEPSMHKVMRDPSLQNQLSLSSQATYLEYLQKRVHANKPETFISQEQVFKLFLAANKQAENAVKGNFGRDFSDLPPEQRIQVMQTLGKQINLEQITNDLNHKNIRAQEVAFLVQGQRSGVARHEASRTGSMEQAHTAIEQKLQQTQQELEKLRMEMKNGSTQVGNVAGHGRMQAANEPNMVAPALTQPGLHEQREIARKQQAAARQAGVAG